MGVGVGAGVGVGVGEVISANIAPNAMSTNAKPDITFVLSPFTSVRRTL